MTKNKIPTEIAENMIKTKVWTSECPVPLERLSLLTLPYYNFDGIKCVGEMVVLYDISEIVIDIFAQLMAIKFPIRKMKAIHHYHGDDNASMEDDNTSCFNYRNIPNTQMISKHSYGLAIDINPRENPYIVYKVDEDNAYAQIFPKSGLSFVNRIMDNRPGMVEDIVDIFKSKGFSWGGEWRNKCIDWHHFEIEPSKFGF